MRNMRAARFGPPATFEPLERRQLLSAAPVAPPGGSAKLTGAVLGTAGSYLGRGNTTAKAFDGNPATFFDGPKANGDWAGLDLGTPERVTQVQFVPRAGFAGRMVGGQFQGSTTADFSADVTTLYTIKTTPASGYTAVTVTTQAAFEYVRYLSPAGGEGNVAEVEFDGYAPATAANTWTDADVGSPGKAGSAVVTAAGAVTVAGGGADIWNSTDQFNFESQPLVGNGTVVARVTAQADTNAWAKAGVMVRETADADSRFVLLALTPGHGLVLQARTASHTTPSVWVTAPATVAAKVGVWVRITRAGSTFTGAVSADGATWTTVGSVTIPMVNNVRAGLAVTAHDDAALSSATFANAAVTAAGTAASVWTDGATAPMTRWESETFSYGGKLYVFGGFIDRSLDATAECDVYDPVANAWSYVTTVPVGGLTHASVAVVGNLAYFAGGSLGSFGDYDAPTTAEVLTFNLSTRVWGTTTPLPVPESCGGLVCIANHLYYYGGLNATNKADLTNTWALDLADPAAGWQARAAMPDGRNHLGAAVINGIAYAVGGAHLYNEVKGNTADVDAYNPVTNTWKAVASLPMTWSSNETTTMVVNGKIVIVGGQTNGGYDGIYLNQIEAYNPASNAWSQAGTLPEANEGESIAYADGELIVADGTVDNLGGWSQDQTWLDKQITF